MQALREGAPAIRRKRKSDVPPPTTTRTKETDHETATKHSKTMSNKETATSVHESGIFLPNMSRPSYAPEKMFLPTAYDAGIVIRSSDRQDEIEPKTKTIEQNEIEQIQQLSEQVQLHHPVNIVAPLTSNREFNEKYVKRFDPLSMPQNNILAETTRLMAALDPDLVNEISMEGLRVSNPSVLDDASNCKNAVDEERTTKITDSIPPTSKQPGFHRVHSLASPDYDSSTNMDCIMGSSEVEFVNPFVDESNAMSINNSTDVVLKCVPSLLTKKWAISAAEEDDVNSETESPPSF
jgi:hypothetical protein